MTADEIHRYLEMLGAELQRHNVTGEIVIVGGAVMLLVIGNRPTTDDIDAYFATKKELIQDAASVIATREGLPPDWINEAVKGFFYTQPPTSLWLEFPGLRVYVANPDYMLAMKAVAGRPSDVADILALAKHLGVTSAKQVLDIVGRYVPTRYVTPKTQYLIEELFPEE